MYTGPLRLLRALTVSATCVALSLAAHFLGAGPSAPEVSAVAVVGLLMITVLLTLILTALSGRRWTLGRSLVALSLGQVGLNAIFTMLLSSHDHQGPTAFAGGTSMALAHGAAALLIASGIAVNDSALDGYFAVASTLVGSGTYVLSPWRLTALISLTDVLARVSAAVRGERSARWQRPRILTDLVVLQCLSRRGPPALSLAS
jgi:hypothetical protein